MPDPIDLQDVLRNVLLQLIYFFILGCAFAFTLTGMFSSEWYKLVKNKLMLHVAVSLILRMLLNIIELNYVSVMPMDICKLMGLMSQYLKLVSFVFLFLKALRKVYFYPHNHMPQCMYFICLTYGWGAPMVITLATFHLDGSGCILEQSDFQLPPFCYAQQMRFYFGVVIPIAVCFLGTIAINVKMYSVTKRSKDLRKTTQATRFRETKLSSAVCSVFAFTWLLESLFFALQDKFGKEIFYVVAVLTPLEGVILIYYLYKDVFSKIQWISMGKKIAKVSLRRK